MPEDETHKPKRERSPNYPGLTLETAIDRASVLRKKQGKGPIPVKIALRDLGYSEKSGAGLVALAALLQFGLLEDQGSKEGRTVRLTPLALEILDDPRSVSPERDQAIREAALRPEIHRSIWEEWTKEYGGIPQEDTAVYSLRKRRFTEGGARDFVRKFRETIAFAGIDSSDSLDVEQPDLDAGKGGVDMGSQVRAPVEPIRTAPPPMKDHRVVNLPLSPSAWAVLQVPIKMSEQDWNQLLAVLGVMKPGIVSEASPEEE